MSGVADSPLIRLDGLSKRFDEVVAVDDVGFDIRANEFFCLLGPSGCGKTTLLRLIAGFERPDAGRVILEGTDITEVRPNRRPVNLMFQSYALFPHMSVWRNVAYGLEMEGVVGAELKRRVEEALELARLDTVANRRPDQLSGGQKQRVALIRALVKRPKVLLLDEPLGALDRKLREEMQLELKRLQHDIGVTFVVVTHDQEEALVMADRIALLDRGRVVQLDGARDLYEHPRNLFAAGFIGVMNFFDGRLDRDGVRLAANGRLVKGAVPAGTAVGRDAVLAVRPERISIAGDGGEDNALTGIVAAVAYHGRDLNLQVRVSGIDRPLVVRLSSGSDQALTLREGDTVTCRWAAVHSRILIE